MSLLWRWLWGNGISKSLPDVADSAVNSHFGPYDPDESIKQPQGNIFCWLFRPVASKRLNVFVWPVVPRFYLSLLSLASIPRFHLSFPSLAFMQA